MRKINHAEWHNIAQRYFNIAMRYDGGENNNEIGRARLIMTIIIVARFGLTSPTVISHLYRMSHRQALEHLNKLVKHDYLILIETHRSPDGRIYICNADGARYAEELTGIPVYFKRFTPASRGVNQSTIMHDLMNSHILLRMMHETSRYDPEYYAYSGMMSEKEFKRQMTKADTRIVDGLILENTAEGEVTIAVEIENSFKTKASRGTILCRYLTAIKSDFYEKVFLISQSQQIIDDIKRLNSQLLEELTHVRSKKTRDLLMTTQDAELLRHSIIYRTKYCAELTELFYS